MLPTHSLDEICPYIREAGLQRQDSWKTKTRRLYDHQFLFCFTGMAHMMVNENDYKLKRGHLVIIPPNTPHRFWVDEGVTGELYWFHCDYFFYEDREWHYTFYNDMERYITLFSSQLQFPEHIHADPVFEGGYKLPECLLVENPDAMEYLFRSIYKSYMQQDALWQLSAKIGFLEILSAILRQTSDVKKDASSHTYIVNQIKGAVASHYYRKLSVAQLCAQTGLNAEYASKIFKQQTGMRLVEYVNRYRVDKAKELLLETDLSAADIAEMVGFSNENYFCTVTKKLEGQTPEKLRACLLELLEATNQ